MVKISEKASSKRKLQPRKATSGKVRKAKEKAPNRKLKQSAPSRDEANGVASNGTQNANNPSPKKPPRFSWVEPGLLAGQGRPTQHAHVQYLCENNFKYIVSLTQNKPRALKEYPGVGLKWIHIPVQDETPPTLDQMIKFCDAVEKARKEKVAISVHCAWGRGRTGTMIACFLAKSRGMTAQEAIKEIRLLRKGSIDTEQQAAAVEAWVQHITA